MFTALLAVVGVRAAPGVMFLPLLAYLAERYGWQGVALVLTATVAVMIVLVAVMLPESPASLGLPPYGAAALVPPRPRQGNPFRVAWSAFTRASRSADFWLL